MSTMQCVRELWTRILGLGAPGAGVLPNLPLLGYASLGLTLPLFLSSSYNITVLFGVQTTLHVLSSKTQKNSVN